MLLADNTALAQALEAPEVSYRVRLRADWDADGGYAHPHSDLSPAANSLSYDRSSGGQLPAETWLVEGYAVGSLRVTLIGDVAGTDVVTLLSTYAADSPLAGHDLVGTLLLFDVEVDTADGPVTVPQFPGMLRSVVVSSGARRVDLEVLDLAAALASRVDLPIASLFSFEAGRAAYPCTTTQWLVDHALRRSGIYATPAARSDAILSVTGHGGLAPEVGFSGLISTWYANSISRWTESVWPGILATGASWASSGATFGVASMSAWYGATAGCDLSVVGRGLAIGQWIHAGATMTNVSPAGLRYIYKIETAKNDNSASPAEDGIWVTIDNTGLVKVQHWHYTAATGGTATDIHTRQLTGAESWRFLGVHVGRESSTVLRATIRADGSATSATINPAGFTTVNKSMGAQIGLYRPWSDWQAWLTPAAPVGQWPGESTDHTPQADIPVGKVEFTALPDNPQASSLSLLRDAVGAEYGTFGFDETGRFAYKPADYAPADTSTPDRVVTTDFPLADLATSRTLDSVRNKITSTVRETFWNEYKALLQFEAEDSTSFTCPANTTVTIPVAVARAPGYPFPARQVPRKTTADFDANPQAPGFVAVQDGTTTEQDAVFVKFTQTGVRTGEFTIRNAETVPVRLKTSSGEPALRVTAYDSTREPDLVSDAIDAPSIDQYGERELGIAPSDWRSKRGPYREIAGQLLVQLRKPVTTLADVPMAGDPRDQIGDLHKLADPGGIGEPIYAVVEGFRRSWSASSGLTQSITYRVQRDETQNTYRGFEGLDAGLVDFFDSWVLAVEFRVTSTSWLSQMGFWRETADVNPTEMRLYRVDSALSGTPVDGTYIAVDPSGPTGAWRWYPLPEPVLLDADQPYYACFLFPNSKWPGVSNYWSTGAGTNGITNGPLFLPGRSGAVRAVNGNGNFVAGAGGMTFPTNFTNAGENRGIDVTVVDTPYS